MAGGAGLRKWAWVMENAKYTTFHTSYMFYWLQSLINYYDYTGDESLVAELTPNVYALIDQFTSYIGPNGIISEAPNYMFMDWVQVHDDENPQIRFPCHHPPAVIGHGYMTALFYRALADAITVSKLENDTTHHPSTRSFASESPQPIKASYGIRPKACIAMASPLSHRSNRENGCRRTSQWKVLACKTTPSPS